MADRPVSLCRHLLMDPGFHRGDAVGAMTHNLCIAITRLPGPDPGSILFPSPLAGEGAPSGADEGGKGGEDKVRSAAQFFLDQFRRPAKINPAGIFGF